MAISAEATGRATEPDLRARFARAIRDASAPTLLLVAASLVSAGILLAWLSDLTFWRDEWAFLLHRRGTDPGVLLEPHYEHIAIVPVAIYKTLQSLFGMDSPTPFQVVATFGFLVSTSLLYVLLKRRVGGWLALAGVLPILFFGPSWDDLLWPFQIGYFCSMAGGLGALLALDSERRRTDIVACALLTLAMASSSIGVAFSIAIAVLVLTGPRVRERLYVFLVPMGLFGLWWLGYGSNADSFVSFHNLATSPSYVLDGFASSLSSLLGLGTPRDEVEIRPLDWGRPLLVGLAAFAAVRLYRRGPIPRGLWVVVALGISFWFLAALNASIFREPESGRYQYVGAVFLLLIAAELFRGVRPSRTVTAIVLAVSVAAAISNLNFLYQTWTGLKPNGELQPAGLGALELVRDQVDPAYQLTEQNSDIDYLGELDAASYFSAIDKYGSPAFTPEELLSASEPARVAADKVFASALELQLEPVAGEPAGRCSAVEPAGPGGGANVELPPGGAVLRGSPGDRVKVVLARYASESFPIAAGTFTGERTLAIPPDGSTAPWRAELRASGPLELCAPR